MIAKKNDSVVLEGMTEPTLWALHMCDAVYQEFGIDEIVVTSGRDSHSDGLHPEGKAFDLRLPSRLVFEQILKEPWDGEEHDIDEQVWIRLVVALGPEFDVILERHHDNPFWWHIHVEHHPD